MIERLKKIKLIILDVDGVLTDGKITYNDDGSETKAFDVKDGLGIRLLLDAGIKIVIVTGRKSKALVHRCQNLGITELFEGVKNKAEMMARICEVQKVLPEEIACVGDDLPDIPVMNRAGFSFTVADADEYVKQKADMITRSKGGNGAVREISENILKAKGLWNTILNRFN